MATRKRNALPHHPTKGYYRDIGPRGAYHRFYLGDDLEVARRTLDRLLEVWQCVERWFKEFGATGDPAFDAGMEVWVWARRGCPPKSPVWDEMTLAVAKAVQRGEPEVMIQVEHYPVLHENDSAGYRARKWHQWLLNAQHCFSMIKIVPEPVEAEDRKLLEHVAQVAAVAPKQREEEAAWHAAEAQRLRGDDRGKVTKGGTLHVALDAFGEVERQRYKGSGHAGTVTRRLAFLMRVLSDMPLTMFGVDEIEAAEDVIVARPLRQGDDKPIAKETAKGTLKTFRRALKWLHRTGRYEWHLPDAFEWRKLRIKKLPEESALAHPFEGFDTKELTALWQHAAPLDRLLIVLGLNCAFGVAEAGTLALSEIFLGRPHPLDKTKVGSWIVRRRRKTDVLGSWSLWPVTVSALRWAIGNRPKTESDILLVSTHGLPLFEQTAGGNRTSLFANGWNRLVARALPSRKMSASLGKLRKTSYEMLREASDGEVAAIHLTHGQPVGSDPLADVYGRRPFHRVYAALERVGETLAPVFSSVTDPFPGSQSDLARNGKRGPRPKSR